MSEAKRQYRKSHSVQFYPKKGGPRHKRSQILEDAFVASLERIACIASESSSGLSGRLDVGNAISDLEVMIEYLISIRVSTSAGSPIRNFLQTVSAQAVRHNHSTQYDASQMSGLRREATACIRIALKKVSRQKIPGHIEIILDKYPL